MSFFLSSIVNKDSHFARLSASSVCKMSHRAFVAFSDPLSQSPQSPLVVLLRILRNDTLRRLLQGFRSGRISKPLRAFTVALSLRPSKQFKIIIV